MMRPQAGMPGRKIGVYGMGEIGRKIAARVAAFEADVGYFSRGEHDVPYRYFPSLAALAEWCSVLMIAVRAGSDTHHVVNADILKRLGPDGYVVNIARGSVIDQDALVAALTDKTIAGAGLDVYAKEPHAPDALTAFPNVVLTPHIGGHTLESHTAMQDLRDREFGVVLRRPEAGLRRQISGAFTTHCLANRHVAQFVRVSHQINRGDFLAVDRHADGVVDLAIHVEQRSDAAVDHGRHDANVVAGILGGKADEEPGDLL